MQRASKPAAKTTVLLDRDRIIIPITTVPLYLTLLAMAWRLSLVKNNLDSALDSWAFNPSNKSIELRLGS